MNKCFAKALARTSTVQYLLVLFKFFLVLKVYLELGPPKLVVVCPSVCHRFSVSAGWLASQPQPAAGWPWLAAGWRGL